MHSNTTISTTTTTSQRPLAATDTLHTTVEVEIASPPAVVWDVVADYFRDSSWRKHITEMTPDRDGPPRVGTNVREVLRLAGRDYVTDTCVTDTCVTEVGPAWSYSFAGRGTSGVVRGRRSAVPGTTPDSTVFAYHVELEPDGVPVPLRPLLRWWLQRSLQRDVRRLRAMLESAP